MLPRIPSFWLRWLSGSILAFMALSATAAPSFKRGVNLSHWLSQNSSPSHEYGASWFGEDDIKWIAEQGYDHVRVPIDGRVWLKADGSIDDSKVEPFLNLLGWVKTHKIAAVLDMHFLPGADFNNDARDTRVFTDIELQEKVAGFWRQVARRFASEGDYLRFEILNEPVAEKNEQLNPFTARMLAAIRESNPTRIVYITSNRWSSFETVTDVEVPHDPNVAVTVHFYEPHLFTHQRASWVGAKPDMPLIPFPGLVPDLAGSVPADHYFQKRSGTVLTIEKDIDEAYAHLATWAAKNAPGKEIYIGEFGVYNRVPDEYREVWMDAVLKACKRHGFSWAVWDYMGGFAVRDRAGNPTAIQRAISRN